MPCPPSLPSLSPPASAPIGQTQQEPQGYGNLLMVNFNILEIQRREENSGERIQKRRISSTSGNDALVNYAVSTFSFYKTPAIAQAPNRQIPEGQRCVTLIIFIGVSTTHQLVCLDLLHFSTFSTSIYNLWDPPLLSTNCRLTCPVD